MSILVLTTEPLPLPGCPTTGAGMRAWGLTFGLRSAGIETHVAFAADSIRGRQVDPSVVPGVSVFNRNDLGGLIDSIKPKALVVQHWGLMRWVPETQIPVAIDLAGPHLLERQLWGSRSPEEDLAEKIRGLARADFVVCSGAFQRHYFLPFLFQAGFSATANLCPVIPFSVAPELPEPDPERDLSRFVYSGFFLPWQDPSKPLRWALEVMDQRDRGRLVLVGGPHPSGDNSGGKFDSLIAELDKHPRVERHPVMPFDQLLGLYRQCGAALDLMASNPERELAFPTRSVVLMGAGLPLIHNNFDELAEPIRRAKAGWTLDPEDEEGFKRVFDRLVSHTEDIARRSEKARELVQKNYTWDRTIDPLAAWCRTPTKREGKRAPLLSVTSESAKTTVAAATPRRKGGATAMPQAASPNRLAQSLSPIALLVAIPVGVVLFAFFGLVELLRVLVRGRS